MVACSCTDDNTDFLLGTLADCLCTKSSADSSQTDQEACKIVLRSRSVHEFDDCGGHLLPG